MEDFPLLIEAIRALGPTNRARGQQLGVSGRAISAYLCRAMEPSIRVIARHPATVAAFCQDAAAQLAVKENASGVAET